MWDNNPHGGGIAYIDGEEVTEEVFDSELKKDKQNG